jgi:RNase P subunit RPR2
MSSQMPPGTYRITVLDSAALKPNAWYDCWTCLECGQILTPGGPAECSGPGKPTAVGFVGGGQTLIVCPSCKADRFYQMNDRTVRQHLVSPKSE